MAITLGSLTFDEARTTVAESHEEVGGRNERAIVIKGVIVGKTTVAAIHAELDAILDTASVEDYSVELSLRAGRRLNVRRSAFFREVNGEQLVGSFTLELGAKNAFEEATAETSTNWPITASGATLNQTAAGNVYAEPKITLVATGAVVNPTFSDGTRTIAYSGTIADGETLIFDAAARIATLEGVDVTPYTTGVFPRVSPESTVLTYTDDASSSHTATVTVAFRNRWW